MKRVLVALSWLLLAAQVSAETEFGVGLKGGTTGVGVELTLGLSRSVNLRGGYSVFQYDEDVEDTDVAYAAEFDMSGASLLLDWHVFRGGFRLTAGVMSYADNQLLGRATPSAVGTYTFNDTTYLAADVGSVEASIEFDRTAPYLGFGWGDALGDGRFSLILDLGVINIGKPDINLDYNCLNPTVCGMVAADIEAEIADLEEETRDYQWWPVINIGVAYRF